ncbi:MAG: hypothetical protein V3T70_07365, partial [Phycisphaerae bacterium]
MNQTRWHRVRAWSIALSIAATVGIAGGMTGGNCNIDAPFGTPQPLPPQPPPPGTDPSGQPDAGGGTNTPPIVEFTWPFAPISVQEGAPLNIQWRVIDPEDAARVSIFARDDFGSDRVLVSGEPGVPPESEHSFVWNTTGSADGIYDIVALVTDGANPPETFFASGRITLRPRPDDPPPPPPPPPLPNQAPSLSFNLPSSDFEIG